MAPHVDGLLAVHQAQDPAPLDDVRREVRGGGHEILGSSGWGAGTVAPSAHRDLVPHAHLGAGAGVHLVHAPRTEGHVIDGERCLQEVTRPGTGEELRSGVHGSKDTALV
ncbi:hypothetical protein GCM10010488_35110 [Oerskovia jenensis]